MDLIHFIRERFNLTILLIEHQMRVVMGICEYITVMDFGESHRPRHSVGNPGQPARGRGISWPRLSCPLGKIQTEEGPMMLEVENLNVYYGAIHALKGISFHVEKGEIVTLIGANGAGKSTTLSTISGLLRSRTGKIVFQGENISLTEPQDIVKKGHRPIPGRAAHLCHLDGDGKSRNGRVSI